MMRGIAVTYGIELETTVKAGEPTSSTKEQFCERRVNIEVIFAKDIKRRKLSEVNFVKPEGVSTLRRTTQAPTRTLLGQGC